MAGHSVDALSTLADRLRAARLLAGISGRELGRLAGVSETYPSMIEAGERPRVEAGVVGRLADVLGVSCDWLIAGRGSLPTAESVQAAVSRARGVGQSATGTDGLRRGQRRRPGRGCVSRVGVPWL